MSVYFHPIYNAVLVICLGLAVMRTMMRTEMKMVPVYAESEVFTTAAGPTRWQCRKA